MAVRHPPAPRRSRRQLAGYPLRPLRSVAHLTLLLLLALFTTTTVAAGLASDGVGKSSHDDDLGLSPRSSPTTFSQTPNAAFVVLAQNSDLSETVASMQQVEDHFNYRYGHSWVFFSTDGLNETFREATTNATNGTCFYEQISHGHHWTRPYGSDHHPHDVWTDLRCKPETDETCVHAVTHMHHWNRALFAHEKRLGEFDFFWRVKPGVSMTVHPGALASTVKTDVS